MASSPDVLRLNLGCGPRLLSGFINVDLPNNWSGKQPDVVSDIRSLPFGDGYADEVHAYHVLEHLYRWEAETTLTEWLRVLKPGGKLILELPCLDKILNVFNVCMSHGKPVPARLTILGLYGDPAYRSEAMCHRWAWSKSELKSVLRSLGLRPRIMEPVTHIPERDMRCEAIK